MGKDEEGKGCQIHGDRRRLDLGGQYTIEYKDVL